ncbi:ribosomal protein L7/L12 [Nocardioides jiangxiensis]|uniref:Ribosomal protein L7/L12 n=1 Tax=Nocardioides jiangxiensis TaxID=3064524 RepID=A0ABT9B4C5_9ACTN|nr:ribosomal protein L7/L12 [Nocardioides sp. WY-20]MDO7869235.1 ribosomal protein L7/L12 [Nocardioides sp. WY-20]
MTVLGDRWISVIKTLREATGMTLSEAKDATAEPHFPLVSGRSQDAAELIAARLRGAGATAVVRPMAD